MRLCYIRHGRYRHLQDPVLAAHRAASLRDPRHSHIPDPEIVETYRRRHNVDDGIDRSHFVEMHFIDRYAVCLGLRLREDLKDPQRQGSCPLRHLQVSDDLPDLPHSCVVMVVAVSVVVIMIVMMVMIMVMIVVMVMVMVMIVVMVMVMVVIMIVVMVMVMIVVMIIVVIVVMAVRVGRMPALPFEVSVQVLHVMVVPVVLLIKDHIEVAAIYSRFLHSADLYLKTMSGNPLQDLQEFLLIRPQIEHRGYSHIAADPGSAFQIKDLITVLHPFYSLRRPGG